MRHAQDLRAQKTHLLTNAENACLNTTNCTMFGEYDCGVSIPGCKGIKFYQLCEGSKVETKFGYCTWKKS